MLNTFSKNLFFFLFSIFFKAWITNFVGDVGFMVRDEQYNYMSYNINMRDEVKKKSNGAHYCVL